MMQSLREPKTYLCDCGQEHTDYGDKPPCWPQSPVEKLEGLIRQLEGRIAELETRLDLYRRSELEWRYVTETRLAQLEAAEASRVLEKRFLP